MDEEMRALYDNLFGHAALEGIRDRDTIPLRPRECRTLLDYIEELGGKPS